MCVRNIMKVKVLLMYVAHTLREFAGVVMPMDPSKLFLQETLLKLMVSVKNSGVLYFFSSAVDYVNFVKFIYSWACPYSPAGAETSDDWKCVCSYRCLTF